MHSYRTEFSYLHTELRSVTSIHYELVLFNDQIIWTDWP